MVEIDARVDHADDNVRASGGEGPRLRRVDVGVRDARHAVHGLAGVVKPPELEEEGVVGSDAFGERHAVVRLDVAHARVAAQTGCRRGRVAGADPYEHRADRPEATKGAGVGAPEGSCPPRRRHTDLEADDELSGHNARLGGRGRRRERAGERADQREESETPAPAVVELWSHSFCPSRLVGAPESRLLSP